MSASSPNTQHYLITGAGGFVGQALASALLKEYEISTLTLTDVFEPPNPSHGANSQTEIVRKKADLTVLETCKTLLTSDITCVYMLHGIMSGQAEGNLDLGMNVNVDSTRLIFDHLRQTNPGVKVIFTSSTAIYGPPPTPDFVFTESTAADPGSSYGAQKHICETLLNDYSRRGLLDGRICRLPTVLLSCERLLQDANDQAQVVVRPGKPTGAASSFASGIFREPLNGETSVLPVSTNLDLWICSPRTVVKNLLLASRIPKTNFKGSRIVNLPGITVSVRQMLDALNVVGGNDTSRLVVEKQDDATQRIVESWPTRLDTSKAKSLGFVDDGTLENSLQQYIEDYVKK